jgi:nucleotide-binding universal stress UspA family protein
MTTLPRSLIVAVDFGDASARAVGLAGLIADRCGATTLRLLHAEALDAPPYFTAEQLEGLERQRHMLRGQAEQFLSRFGRQHTRVPCTTIVDDRPPVDAILHESTAADLVVMGTHGRHGPKRWWLGSVAERVLRDVGRPLLIVRAETSQPVESTFDRVVVHASPPLAGEHALHYARSLASCFNGQVVDARHGLIEPALEAAHATMLVSAAPHPRSSAWLSNYGEPLVRFCTVPILFVPEIKQGASSSNAD